MRVLRSADYRRMPWKNGGGETQEILVAPAGATLDTLDWRVSLARVAQDGPFSVFNGVQRTLCVLRGNGIQLQTADQTPVDLYVASEPYTFDGAAATSSHLLDGPIVDLNVMSRRGRFRHHVRRLSFKDSLLLKTAARPLIVYCQRGEVTCGAETLLSDDSAMFSEPAGHIRLVTNQPTTQLIVIELFPE